MRAASERLEFERAGIFRDRKQRLEELVARFGRLRFAVESLSFLYLVPGHDREDRCYVVRRGVVRHEQPSPQTPAEWAALERRVQEVFRDAPHAGNAIPAHEVDELLLLTSWFSTRPEEMSATLPPGALTR